VDRAPKKITAGLHELGLKQFFSFHRAAEANPSDYSWD
jgi:hypothetical protein